MKNKAEMEQKQQTRLRRLEHYERMHQKMQQGQPVRRIMLEELAAAFPLASEEERQQMAEGFIQSSRSFMSRMRVDWNERKTSQRIWQEKLCVLDRDQQLELLRYYRLLCEMMKADGVKEILAEAEKDGSMETAVPAGSAMLGKPKTQSAAMAKLDEIIRKKMQSYDTKGSKIEQVENLLEWACKNKDLEILFWKQQEEILKELKELSAEGAAKEFFYARIDTEEERALFACATLLEPGEKLGWTLQKVKTMTPEERPDLRLDSLAGIVAASVNASLECEKVYVDLSGDLIDEEEAETRLARIWNCLEEGLIEWIPGIVSWLVFCVLALGTLSPVMYLFVTEVITSAGLATLLSVPGILISIGGYFVSEMITEDVFGRMFRKIGNKIRLKSHEQNKLEANYTRSDRVRAEQKRVPAR